MVSRRTNCFCGDIATQMVRSDRDWVYTVNDYPNAWRKLCWERIGRLGDEAVNHAINVPKSRPGVRLRGFLGTDIRF